MTTPDQYPLSLNAACNGSNQKSNRDPVVHFSEAEVTVALQGLRMKHLAGATQPLGSRVEKWRHNAKETLSLTDRQAAVLAELLLRGPQQPGELRTRVSRMAKTDTLEELAATLRTLQEKGHVRRLAPTPGARAERYGQLLAPTLYPDGVEPAPAREAAPLPRGEPGGQRRRARGRAARVARPRRPRRGARARGRAPAPTARPAGGVAGRDARRVVGAARATPRAPTAPRAAQRRCALRAARSPSARSAPGRSTASLLRRRRDPRCRGTRPPPPAGAGHARAAGRSRP